MGEELTGVTLGGFGGRSPPFSPPPRPLASSSSFSLASPLSQAFSSGVGQLLMQQQQRRRRQARTPLGVF